MSEQQSEQPTGGLQEKRISKSQTGPAAKRKWTARLSKAFESEDEQASDEDEDISALETTGVQSDGGRRSVDDVQYESIDLLENFAKRQTM